MPRTTVDHVDRNGRAQNGGPTRVVHSTLAGAAAGHAKTGVEPYAVHTRRRTDAPAVLARL
eukprot:380249-Lingulodinium_polyedra.AAC.1